MFVFFCLCVLVCVLGSLEGSDFRAWANFNIFEKDM